MLKSGVTAHTADAGPKFTPYLLVRRGFPRSLVQLAKQGSRMTDATSSCNCVTGSDMSCSTVDRGIASLA